MHGAQWGQSSFHGENPARRSKGVTSGVHGAEAGLKPALWGRDTTTQLRERDGGPRPNMEGFLGL